jgi:paraquat-inducible protein A
MQGGRFATGDLLLGPERLAHAGASGLALVVLLTLLVMPLVRLSLVAAMALGVTLGKTPAWLRRGFARLPSLGPWAMTEVFLLGAMIALLRLHVWMQVSYGPALLALSGVTLCSVAIDASMDGAAFWRRVGLRAAPARSQGPLLACDHCGLVEPNTDGAACRRCGCAIHARKPNSVKRTWALLAAAGLLAIPANVLPVMTITRLGRGGPSTILGGTLELIHVGMWGLALLVFVASILVPLIKLLVLSLLLLTIRRRSTAKLAQRTRLYRVVAVIGRWSLLDIFATMTLVTFARFGWLGNVLPDAGVTAFCGVAVLTMLASEAFDPRLMWDAARENRAVARPGWGAS